MKKEWAENLDLERIQLLILIFIEGIIIGFQIVHHLGVPSFGIVFVPETSLPSFTKPSGRTDLLSFDSVSSKMVGMMSCRSRFLTLQIFIAGSGVAVAYWFCVIIRNTKVLTLFPCDLCCLSWHGAAIGYVWISK